jgi:hypothetical protein
MSNCEPDFEIDIPAPDDNIEMTVGQCLQITFVEARRFCTTSGSADFFDPALPVGPQKIGYVWTGTALAAGIDQKIMHHDVEHDAECGSSKKRSPSRSIQISGSIPP